MVQSSGKRVGENGGIEGVHVGFHGVHSRNGHIEGQELGARCRFG
uniref:Uncharacterized protein n=1 Tax=Rhizophora mucronata TaxID=61149 RepID=A0A2P2N6H4_RHIMU